MTAMTEEQAQILELAREFAEAELRPHVEAWDRARALAPEALAHLAELGFFGMLVPDSYGGLGFELPTYAGVLEALAWGEPVVALTLSIHSAFAATLVLRHGDEEQQRHWLPTLASGETLGCFAISEAGAGSDVAAIQTRARPDDGGWVLSGEKRWVTNGRAAGLALVIARTEEQGEADARTHGLSAFLVPTSTPGYDVAGRERTMGLHAVEVNTIRLNDVRLGEDALLGDAGAGFAYAMEGLDLGRLGIAAQAVGIAHAALDHAVAYAGEREQFGRAIREFEGMQFKLADMATRVDAARALVQAAASAPAPERAAMAKLFASETAMMAATQAVQVFGGYGYMKDYPVEKLMRDAKATEIYEGTNEIQRLVIARALYRTQG